MEKKLLGELVCRKKTSENFTPFGDYNMTLVVDRLLLKSVILFNIKLQGF